MKRSSLTRWPFALALVAGVGGVSCSDADPTNTSTSDENAVAQQLQSEIDVAVTQNALTASQVKALKPVLKCVEKTGSNSYKAHFGYSNSSSGSISIPVGFFNRFWPPPANRGQQTSFAPGSQADVVQVPFTGNNLVVWILGLHFDIATRHSHACPAGGTGGVSGTGGQGTGGQGTGGQGTGGRGTGGQGTGGQGTGGQGTGGQGTGGQGTGGAPPPMCPSTCDDHNPCTLDFCNASTGFLCENSNIPDNTTCSDGNACTTGDVCLSGVCTGGAPLNCAATDQCHAPGTCSPATGCSNPTAPNGQSCSDGNACTTGDTCQAGACAPGVATACQPSGQCRLAGVCAPATGICSDPPAANGASCNDGNACTTGDTCQAGSCTPGTPRVCTASGVCHVAGVCDAATGGCSDPPAANGTTCDDSNLCTVGDSCQAGACAPGAPKVCAPSGAACHVAGVCAPTTGVCSDALAANGASCDDGNTCSTGDSCQAGVCTPTASVTPSLCTCAPGVTAGCETQACLTCGSFACSDATDGCGPIVNPVERGLCEALYACGKAATHPNTTVPGFCTFQGDATTCWCGTNPTTCAQVATGPTAANGPCLQQVFDAAHSTDPGFINAHLADPATALGRAFNLLACRGAFCGLQASGDCPIN